MVSSVLFTTGLDVMFVAGTVVFGSFFAWWRYLVREDRLDESADRHPAGYRR